VYYRSEQETVKDIAVSRTFGQLRSKVTKYYLMCASFSGVHV